MLTAADLKRHRQSTVEATPREPVSENKAGDKLPKESLHRMVIRLGSMQALAEMEKRQFATKLADLKANEEKLNVMLRASLVEATEQGKVEQAAWEAGQLMDPLYRAEAFCAIALACWRMQEGEKAKEILRQCVTPSVTEEVKEILNKAWNIVTKADPTVEEISTDKAA